MSVKEAKTDDFSEEESKPLINNQMEERINSLSNELPRFNSFSNRFQKYFDYLSESNETIDSNEELLDLKNNIKVLKDVQNFISVEKLNENQLKFSKLKSRTNVTKTDETKDSTQTKIIETNHQLTIENANQREVNANDSNKTLKKQISSLKEDIKALKILRTKCLISYKDLSKNEFKLKSTQNYVEKPDVPNTKKTSTEMAENIDELIAGEVSDDDSEGIDCEINYTNLSNDEIIDGSIDEEKEWTEKLLNNISENKLIEQSLRSNESQIITGNTNSISKKEFKPLTNNQWKQRIISLSTDLIRFKLLSNSYNKYFDYFTENNETIDSNEELLGLKNKIIALKEEKNSGNISVEILHKNQLKFSKLKSQTYVENYEISTELENINKLSAEEVSNNDLEAIDGSIDENFMEKEKPIERTESIEKQFTDLNEISKNISIEQSLGTNESQNQCNEEELRNERIDENSEENSNESSKSSDKRKHESNDSSEKTNKKLKPNNENQSHENPLNLNKGLNNGNHISISDESKDNDIECIDLTKDNVSNDKTPNLVIIANPLYLIPVIPGIPVAPNPFRFRCDVEGCSMTASAEIYLKQHKKAMHSITYLCRINDCNKEFKVKTQLKTHQLRAHPQELDDIPWFECSHNDCNFKTKLENDFTAHQKKHTRPYVCAECQKCFAIKNRLNRHMKTHSIGMKIACDWTQCKRRFHTMAAMKGHMNSHTLEISHSCHWPNCDKKYTNKNSLYTHMARHEGKGGYKCPHCDYGSTNTIRYKNHLEKHENQNND